MKFRGTALKDGHVAGSSARRIEFDFHLDLAAREQVIQDLLNAPIAAGTQIVDLAGLALLQGELIAPHDVPYVREIPAGFEVAHADDGLRLPRSIRTICQAKLEHTKT